MSTQGGAQEPESPDKPEEPGTMPDDPCRRPMPPTCPLIPTASRHNPRLTSRGALSSQGRRKGLARVNTEV